jgi:hypothetical protein
MSDWKYELDEVGEDAEPDEPDPELEPGSPSLENALFVALGIASTLFVFARIILMAGG